MSVGKVRMRENGIRGREGIMEFELLLLRKGREIRVKLIVSG